MRELILRISFIKENIEEFNIEEIEEKFDMDSPNLRDSVFEWINDTYKYDYKISRNATSKLENQLNSMSSIPSYSDLNQIFISLDKEFGSEQEAEYFYKRGFKISKV